MAPEARDVVGLNRRPSKFVIVFCALTIVPSSKRMHMKTLDLKEVESHPETAQMVKTLSAEKPQAEWVQLFSANGKHAISVRRDPSEQQETK